MTDDLRVDVDPHVVFELGETLISDDVGAIVELVKNSYDADATRALVTIDAEAPPPREAFYSDTRGYVLVEDDGTGMDEADIRRGWLVVAHSGKRESKARGATTSKFGRTPLGDKGLGRLGTQRLGYVVELFTTKSDAELSNSKRERFHVGIDWRDFESRMTLGEIPVRFKTSLSERTGTRVLVSELRNPTDWTSDALEDLQRRLSQFIFPYEGRSTFKVLGTLNGHPLDLVQISRELLQTASTQVEFKYEQGHLNATIKYRLSAVRPQSREGIASFESLVQADRGRTLFGRLAGTRGFPGLVEYSEKDPWFLIVAVEQDAGHLAGIAIADGSPQDPGPFHGQLASFDFGRESVRDTALKDYRRIVQTQAGVKVFRDGFAIRPYGMGGNDWLRLGSAQTSGSSFYGLRPANVIGYVAISARGNSQLEEKTDREGFTDTPYARNFQLIMERLVQSVNTSTESLRRGFNSLATETRRGATGSKRSPFESMRRASVSARKLADDSAGLRATANRLESAVGSLATAQSAGTQSKAISTRLVRISAELTELVSSINTQAARLRELTGAAALVEDEVARLNDQIEEFTELAALGLSVEAVAHELRNIIEGLNQRTRRVASLSATSTLSPEVTAYLAYVRSTVTGLRKQLSHIAPALRYVRESRDEFSLEAFLHNFAAFHQAGLQRKGIRLDVADDGPDVTLRMNQGRLGQVLDNFVLNSRYWLLQPINSENEKVIHLDRIGSLIAIWDSGRGIDPAIEARLFEPFVTNKPRASGRGLGLFIVRRLLEPYGSHVSLDSARNTHGNLFKFNVDLTGAVLGQDT